MTTRLTPELEADLRTRVCVTYVNTPGTEGYERTILLGEIDRLRAKLDVAAAALRGLHSVCEIALEGKGGKQHSYFETRTGHFVEATAAMQQAETALTELGDNDLEVRRNETPGRTYPTT